MKIEQEDLYPSRCSARPQVIGRIDPVVYSNKAAAGNECVLSEDQIRRYGEDGFLFIDRFFTENEINDLILEMNKLRHDSTLAHNKEMIIEPDNKEIRSIFDIHALSEVFQDLSQDSRLQNIARRILEDEVYVHQSRLNYKPGLKGREFFWHSDFETWHAEGGMPRMRALSMSIILSENNEFNGPLMLIPGSHKYFVSCVGETPEFHYRQSLRRQEFGVPDASNLEKLVRKGGIVAPKGPPGSLLIFDCNTMHGSNSNISPFPRSNVFFVFNALKNRLVQPFSGTRPRPSFIARRRTDPPQALSYKQTA